MLWEVDQHGLNVFCGCAESLADLGFGQRRYFIERVAPARNLSCHAPNGPKNKKIHASSESLVNVSLSS